MIAPRRYPSSRPFLAAPRVDFYHPAQGIDAALQGLDRLIRRAEGIGLVVGPAGTGKSLLLAKVAESVREDFDVALLSGARICTRRALWQSILAEIGEPYRGIDEGELRIGVVERIRGLAATGSGLVVLVDEANTLPTRLIEELRLLTNILTPMPAVHILLAGTGELEEILAAPKMESLSQRIGGRFYLEPLDHAETVAYVRTQTQVATLDWNALFESGCDDAVFTASDGVPRLINQVCDQALVLVAQAGRQRATPADIAAAWREIQRLPAPASLARVETSRRETTRNETAIQSDFYDDGVESDLHGIEIGEGIGMIEFGSLDQPFLPATGSSYDNELDIRSLLEEGVEDTVLESIEIPSSSDDRAMQESSLMESATVHRGEPADPWHGPDVELVFDSTVDPFEEYFEQEERVVERYVMRGPEDFSTHRHVASREGLSMARKLDALEIEQTNSHPITVAVAPHSDASPVVREATHELDDSNMVVIEEDSFDHPSDIKRSIFAVRLGDYRGLFARLRRGDRAN